MEYVGITNGVISLIQSLTNLTHHVRLVNVMEDLDLQVKLDIIEGLLNGFHHNESPPDSESRCIKHLTASVDDIHEILKSIDEKIATHAQKYFAGWREPNYYAELEQLKVAERNMMSRFNMLCVMRNASS